MSGLSQIRRCPAIESQDGFEKTQQLDEDDRFCLDSQKLIVLDNQQYGEIGSEYRTYRDTYKKILLDSDRNFIVYEKSGKIATFEAVYVEDSLIYWRLFEMSDRYGNYISYNYLNKDTYLSAIPSSISFGGNKKASLAHYRHIYFDYQNTTKQRTIYRYGLRFQTAPLLESIRVVSEEKELWNYRFEYTSPPMEISHYLESIAKCTGKGECLRPTRFNYENKDEELLGDFERILEPSGDPNHWSRTISVNTFLDLNRDGHLDLVSLRPHKIWTAMGQQEGLGPFTATESELTSRWMPVGSPVSFGDIDLDGYSDVITFMLDEVRIAFGDGSGFSDVRKLDLPELTTMQKPKHDLNSRFLIDMNKDGILDILAINALEIVEFRGTGDRSQPFKKLRSFKSDLGHFNTDPRLYSRSVVDLNIDGYPDLAYFKDEGVVVALGSEVGLLEAEVWHADFAPKDGWLTSSTRKFFSDVNGDGIPDIVGNQNNGVWVALGTGNGFAPTQKWISYFSEKNDWYPDIRFLTSFDYNGDDIADFVGLTPRFVIVVLGTGAAQEESEEIVVKQILADRTFWSYRTDPINFGLNSLTGRPELILLTYTGRIYMKNETPHQLLTEVVDGLGKTTKITWSSTLDDPSYREEFSSNYPDRSLAAHRMFVKQIEKSDGIGGYNKILFNYSGAKVNLKGGGFLGYETVEKTDLSSGNQTIVRYSQDSSTPLMGMPLEVSNYQLKDDGKSLKRKVKYQYRLEKSEVGGFYQVYPQEVETTAFDEWGDLLSQTIVKEVRDHLGNVLETTTIIEDDSGLFSSEMINRFDFENEDDWLIGRLSFSETRRSGPVGADIIRKASFDYYPQIGKLKTEYKYFDTPDELKKTYIYDEYFGNIIALKSELSNSGGFNKSRFETTYEYDELGFQISSANALGHVNSFEYDPYLGLVNKQIDPNKQFEKMVYDDWGRLIASSTSRGET